MLPNTSFHLTKPFVTHLAGARSAPTVFAGEASVRWTKGRDTIIAFGIFFIRGNLVKILRVLVFLFLLSPSFVFGDPETEDQMSAEKNAIGEGDSPGISWNIQAGVFYRIGGERYRESSGSAMGTIDLSWSKWDKKSWTWGLGIHSAFSDDGGPRFAPYGLYRTPLGQGSSFFQVSGGVYVAAIDQEMNNPDQNTTRLNLPGYFLEAEYGVTDWLSLVLGGEALPVDIYDSGEYSTDSATPVDSTINTNIWLGAKAGKLIGLGAIIAAGLLVGIFAAAYGA